MQTPTPPATSPSDPTAKIDLSGLSAILEAARVKNGVPGMSVAVMYKGEIVFAEGFGKRNEHQPFTKETISPIGSLTKAITCTAIGELVAEGKMDWDKTPVNKYLPEFELKDPVLTSQLTMADLLSHHTRLSPAVGQSWLRSRTPRRELITRLRHASIPQKLTPTYNYSNVMYAVAGEAAANVAGTTYEQLVSDKILIPLGLSNTGFSQNAMKKLENHASPYLADSLSKAQAGEFRGGVYDEIPMAFAPAGDLHSNVLDLLKWGKVVLDGGKVEGGEQVLSKESVEMTLTPQSIVPQKRTPEMSISMTYGLGWFLATYKGRNMYTHSGGYPGSVANLTIFPDDNLIIAQLVNIYPTELPFYADFFIADKILNLPAYPASTQQDWLFNKAVEATAKQYDTLEEERDGKELPTRIKGTVSALLREDMVGQFENPLYGVITIARGIPDKDEGKEKGEEGLEFRYNEYRSTMEHYHYETFKMALEDLGVSEARLVSFEIGSDGLVAGLNINFEDPDLVRFVKVKTSTATVVAEKEE
ncbi:MAG: beta-lactamase/transpeptidase-like protein [Linnemannia elongata]|nr:MAG: beta-lactamase/transpeptidase-like protein [Linnemannia elongata]